MAPDTRWYSLRRRLLGLLLGGLSALWLAIVASSYVDAHHEVDELFDAQMTQIARSLLAIAEHEQHEDRAIDEIDDSLHRYARKFQFQIWRADGSLLMRSSNAPGEPLSAAEGFSDRDDPHGHWRQFALSDDDAGLRVIVAEHHHGRDELVGHIALRLAIPALIGLPLIGFWIWVATRHALKPLNAAADQIAEREPNQLAPIALTTAPVEIRPMLAALNQLFERVEGALAQERRLTADAAHEMRTPLAALQAQTQVALRARDDAERRQSLQQIQVGLERTAHLVEQMLLLARLDPESALPAPSTVDLCRTAETVCAELGTLILDHQIDFALECAAPCPVTGQPEWLHVLIRNLVDNAVRYTPEGGTIRVELLRDGAASELRVSDSGPGIPPGEREAVLRRFHRLHGSDRPGSGLGLAIVARIAELHGATLHLEDAPAGHGLQVRVRWPDRT